ncbi:hypothetical protein SDC9_202226 [bioreactor metagenome]|uniref:Uncharacterized protein n=1 Tax=bioreactor metagenome TaxID=1076179 RepID=A0A645IT24_9ZZZZ
MRNLSLGRIGRAAPQVLSADRSRKASGSAASPRLDRVHRQRALVDGGYGE